MTAPNATAELLPSDSTLSENARYLRGVFHEIIDIAGMFLRVTANDFAVSRAAARQTGETVDRVPYVAEVERLTAVIRRTAMLDMKLEEKPAPAHAAREPVPRGAGQATTARPERVDHPDRLDKPECADRPDRPDRLERVADEDISHLPVAEAVSMLRRDLRIEADPKDPPKAHTQVHELWALIHTMRDRLKAAERDRESQGPPPPNITA